MTSKLGGRGRRVRGFSTIFDRYKHVRFWALLLLIFGAIAASWIATPSPVAAQAKTKVNPKDGLTYVWIPPGTLQMGYSPDDSGCGADEKPARSVTISKGFWIGQTLVTQAAYKKVVTANPNIYRADQEHYPTEMAGVNPSIFKGDQLPVEQLSWDDAKAYCEGVGMRLPTEAEWEYAARGGSAAATYARLDQIAWYEDNSSGSTHDVGQKQANGYGLYDMLGNVWEWVADWYGPYDAAPAADPKGPAHGTFRVMRGGACQRV